MPAVSFETFSKDLAAAPVIAILRGVTPETVLPVCHALADGGVRFIEVTLNSPDPIQSIERAAAELPGRGVHIGAGTVRTAEEVERVAEAGGSYIISPNTRAAVIERTKELGLISIPGFMTPSEAFDAVDAGADLVKCFPVGSLGAGYIKDLRAVLPTPVLAVGGVNRDNMGDYLAAGAAGVGIGSSLFKPSFSVEQIGEKARALMGEWGRHEGT